MSKLVSFMLLSNGLIYYSFCVQNGQQFMYEMTVLYTKRLVFETTVASDTDM